MLKLWNPEIMNSLLLLAPLNSSIGYGGKGDFSMAPDGRLKRRGERQIVPFAFAGVSLCDARLFEGAPDGKFSLNLLWDRALAEGRLYGMRLDGHWMHVGTPAALAEAETWFEPKVPDPSGARPRLYTIPPSAPFLSTLAIAVLNGDLPVPGGAKPDALELPRAIIYLPTRRAVRALRDAFLEAAGGRAVLLPSIRALGDPDEDAAIIFGGEGNAEEGFAGGAGARGIGPLERRLALMRLVLAWSKTLHESDKATPDQAVPPVATPAQASYLAADLGNLMDFIESEEVDLSALEELAPEEHAVHWQHTIEFLKIVTEHWPAHLAEHRLVSPTARRNALMDFEADRLLAVPPAGPVIAAGSTGTVRATARLLKVIASLPNGAVVLPGLDFSLDPESWASLSEHPEHPQTGMAELLTKLGATREDVACVPGSEPGEAQRARLGFVSEILRPAGETDRWQAFLHDDAAPAKLTSGLAGLQTLETPTAHDEAEAIALVLRETIETRGKTAALITPDRTLARRVAARLRPTISSSTIRPACPSRALCPAVFSIS